MTTTHFRQRPGAAILLGTALSLTLLAPTSTTAQVSVLTQHNNNARTGANLQETTLNQTSVTVNNFGLLFKLPVDGQVYAQPLTVAQVPIPGKGTHNLVLVATMHNSVYAFDADQAGPALWQVSLGPSVAMSQSIIHTYCGGNYLDITDEIGILSTPVIDPATNTVYVEAKTLENGQHIDRLHALDLTTGAQKPNSPVIITGSVAGAGDGSQNGQVPFQTTTANQRAALLLSGGIVYVTFAGYCDQGPYHGWMFGYDAGNLQNRKLLFNSTPNNGSAGIWMSGQGPATDDQGNVYVITGNGGFSPASGNYGESFLKLAYNSAASTMTVADYFTPYNYSALNAQDMDLGSAGPLLIPNTTLLTSAGKEGIIYLVDRTKMGKNRSGSNSQIVQSIKTFKGHLHGSPVYWGETSSKGYTYWWSEADRLKSFRFQYGKLSASPTSQGPQAPNGNGMPGAMLSVSANGTDPKSAILWATIPKSGDANHNVVPGMLRAFDATNVAKELWNSEQNAPRDGVGNFAKFCPPTIANGKVYLATFSNQLLVYGLLPKAPASTPAQMTIYPNPADRELTVDYTPGTTDQSGAPTAFSVQLRNERGDVLKTGESKTGRLTLDTHDLAPGTYYLHLIDGQGALLRKAVLVK